MLECECEEKWGRWGSGERRRLLLLLLLLRRRWQRVLNRVRALQRVFVQSPQQPREHECEQARRDQSGVVRFGGVRERVRRAMRMQSTEAASEASRAHPQRRAERGVKHARSPARMDSNVRSRPCRRRPLSRRSCPPLFDFALLASLFKLLSLVQARPLSSLMSSGAAADCAFGLRTATESAASPTHRTGSRSASRLESTAPHHPQHASHPISPAARGLEANERGITNRLVWRLSRPKSFHHQQRP